MLLQDTEASSNFVEEERGRPGARSAEATQERAPGLPRKAAESVGVVLGVATIETEEVSTSIV
jgi:hypothetical protein